MQLHVSGEADLAPMPRGMKVSGTKGPSPWDPMGPFINQEPWETSAASWASLTFQRLFFIRTLPFLWESLLES